MEWALLMGATVPGLLLMIFSWYYKVHPPKNINFIYGYRTRKSMRNQETWKFGNSIGAKMMFYVDMSTLVVGTSTYFISPLWSFGISSFFLIVAMFVGIFWCEQQLAANFDKKGRPIDREGKPE